MDTYEKLLGYLKSIRHRPVKTTLFVLGFVIFAIASLFFNGYFGEKGRQFASTPSEEISLDKLNTDQVDFLKKIWSFQKTHDFDKVLIPSDEGDVTFNGIMTERIEYDLKNKVIDGLGPVEEIVNSVPQEFLRVIPDARFPGVMVISIPKEVGEKLERGTK